MRYQRTTPRKVYRKPPLVEVVFEFRYERSPFDALLPGLLEPLIRQDFPNLEQPPESPIMQEHQLSEIRFVNSSRTLMAQVSRGRWAVSSFRPTGDLGYIGFESLAKAVTKLSTSFRDVHPRSKPTRLGYRYVNHIDVPGSPVIVNELFQVGAYFPALFGKPEWSNNSFAVEAAFRCGDTSLGSSVRMELRPINTPSGERFLLDVDCYCDQGIALAGIPDWLQEAHDLAGDVFESCIGDPLRVVFEEVAAG